VTLPGLTRRCTKCWSQLKNRGFLAGKNITR
jgi:hypothetical protein